MCVGWGRGLARRERRAEVRFCGLPQGSAMEADSGTWVGAPVFWSGRSQARLLGDFQSQCPPSDHPRFVFPRGLLLMKSSCAPPATVANLGPRPLPGRLAQGLRGVRVSLRPEASRAEANKEGGRLANRLLGRQPAFRCRGGRERSRLPSAAGFGGACPSEPLLVDASAATALDAQRVTAEADGRQHPQTAPWCSRSNAPAGFCLTIHTRIPFSTTCAQCGSLQP